MLRHLPRSCSVVLAVAVAATVAAASSPAHAQQSAHEGEPRSFEGRVDPLLPMGTATAASGSGLLLAGAAMAGEGGVFDEMLLVGGGAIAAGGGAMLLVGLTTPPEGADRGRARAAAGGMGLSIAAGMVLMGAVTSAHEEWGTLGGGLIGVGVATSVVSAPILAWGVATSDGGERLQGYAGEASVVGGATLMTLGVGGTAMSLAMLASASCDGGLCGLELLGAAPPFLVGTACLATGAPLFVAGTRVGPGDVVPEVRIGAGDVALAWTLR